MYHLYCYLTLFLFSAQLPVIILGRPQLQLGGIWLGQPTEEGEPAKDSKPSVGLSTGGIQFIREKPGLTGLIQLQVFITKGHSKELVKIHESNSSFSIPDQESRTGSNPCDDRELKYEADGKCYSTAPGADTPCASDFMQFNEISNKKGYGKCECLRFKGPTTRPVVYWEQSNKCYWLYDQGPCEKDQWLVFSNGTADGNKKLQCAKRTCPENTAADVNTNYPKFWFEHKGKCYKTETESAEFCGNGDVSIYFALEKPEPVCLERRPIVPEVKGLASGVPLLRCKPGHKRQPNGECKQTASFE